LEEVFTVYVREFGAHPALDKKIKVISQAEQLALSVCSRNSGGRLWCGSCHDPHSVPERPAAYFREKCLACHSDLAPSHAAPGRDCVGCHMAQRPAKDGGHTAFTDHRISKRPEADDTSGPDAGLMAWREPDPALRARNLALALATAGLQEGNASEAIRGYRMLNQLEPQFTNDCETETVLGNILLKGKQPGEAELRFARALRLRPNYAPYEVNLAVSLLDQSKVAEGAQHLERAVQLDPLLQQGVELVSQVYRSQGEEARADGLLSRYRQAMGMRVEQPK
jgi:tetratricopeptide (TPR) repeat protein